MEDLCQPYGGYAINKRKERKIFAKSLSIVECHKFFIFPVKMNRQFLRQHTRLIKKKINPKKANVVLLYSPCFDLITFSI